MTAKQAMPAPIDISQVPADDPEYLRPLVQALVEEALEAEMTAALGAAKGGADPGPAGYWSGSVGSSSGGASGAPQCGHRPRLRRCAIRRTISAA
jgi:hypothetical protein